MSDDTGPIGDTKIVAEWLKELTAEEQDRAIKHAFKRLDDSMFDREGVMKLTDNSSLSVHDGLFMVVKTDEDGIPKETLTKDDLEYGTLDVRVFFSGGFDERLDDYDKLSLLVGLLHARACASLSLAHDLGVPLPLMLVSVLGRLAKDAGFDFNEQEVRERMQGEEGSGYEPAWMKGADDPQQQDDGAPLYY